ncbi:hypothetical protein V3N99_09750 [Dermatophilaceae bacterium Soc4.6]
MTHDHVRHEVEAERWRPLGHQTVALHRGPVDDVARRWRAVWEVGHRIAVLDGVTALQHAGLSGFSSPMLHVSIPHGCRPYRVSGVVTHTVPVRMSDEVVGSGLPRTAPDVAAIRAAHWAASDRQAALILCLTVQQRLTTPERLLAAAESLRIRGRARLVATLVADLADGVQSLGELDFARLCRARGLPEPTRQAVVQTATGRAYLDVRWSGIGLVVEIDGPQHREGLAVSEDNLSRNEIVVLGDSLLRIDLVGLRLQTAAFMDQVCRAHARLSARSAA